MKFIQRDMTEQEYVQLVKDTWGEYSPHTKHDVIVCEDDGKSVAVFNYFTYVPRTMYLHHSWYESETKKKVRKVRYWLGFFDYAKEIGFDYIMGVIDAENIPALVWVLKTGFFIVGTRIDISGRIIVEILKKL